MSANAQRWADEIQSATNIRMGTHAHHKLGDISRDEPDYFVIESESDEDYFGHWLTGFGFINVRFPKETTREMTPEERQFLAENPVGLS